MKSIEIIGKSGSFANLRGKKIFSRAILRAPPQVEGFVRGGTFLASVLTFHRVSVMLAVRLYRFQSCQIQSFRTQLFRIRCLYPSFLKLYPMCRCRMNPSSPHPSLCPSCRSSFLVELYQLSLLLVLLGQLLFGCLRDLCSQG